MVYDYKQIAELNEKNKAFQQGYIYGLKSAVVMMKEEIANIEKILKEIS